MNAPDLGAPIVRVVALAAASDATLLALALLGRPGSRVVMAPVRLGLARLAGAALLGTALFAAKVALASRLGLIDGFGFLHMLYAEAVVVVPAVAGVLLWADRRGSGTRVPSTIRIAATYALLLAPLGAYGTLVEPSWLAVERGTVPVPGERTGVTAVRIGVLADIQTRGVTAYERRAIARLNEARPDVVLVAGDLLQGTDEAFDRELPALRALLGSIVAPAGAFAVPGNVDHGDRLERAVAGTSVRALRNEIADVRVRDRSLSIVGVDWFGDERGAYDLLDAAARAPGTADIRIVLSHLPDAVLALPPSSRLDLVVAGHTHGGQVRFPLLGPIITLSAVPRHVAAGGLHSVSGNRVYVSRGVGAERGQAPLVRILCRPEVTLLALGADDAVGQGRDGR